MKIFDKHTKPLDVFYFISYIFVLVWFTSTEFDIFKFVVFCMFSIACFFYIFDRKNKKK